MCSHAFSLVDRASALFPRAEDARLSKKRSIGLWYRSSASLHAVTGANGNLVQKVGCGFYLVGATTGSRGTSQ
jgi:hypothetical protein